MSDARRRRMQTVDTLLAGYTSLSVPQLLEPLAEDFQHRVMPSSLGMPVHDRASFATHATGIFGVFRTFKIVPRAILDDSHAGIVVIDAQMEGTLKWDRGEWRNECIMIIRFTEDWKKVTDIREFVDSAKAKEMARAHAPEDFGAASDDGSSSDSDGGRSFWSILDTDFWIHIGAISIVAFALRRLFRE